MHQQLGHFSLPFTLRRFVRPKKTYKQNNDRKQKKIYRSMKGRFLVDLSFEVCLPSIDESFIFQILKCHQILSGLHFAVVFCRR